MKKNIVLAAVLGTLFVIALVLALFTRMGGFSHGPRDGGMDGIARMCTEEAKLCPDGSYVGRSGPNCEFAPCPGQRGSVGSFPAPMEDYPTNNLVTLSLGRAEAQTVNGLELTFQRVLKDTRCPLDAECISVGDVAVELQLARNGISETKVLTLSDDEHVAPLEENGDIAFFGEYAVLLVDVSPASTVDATKNPTSSYTVTLQVERSIDGSDIVNALRNSEEEVEDDGMMCTQEAKMCPDGSYVSRTEPGCQFAACPGVGGVGAPVAQ